jgi:hypothetical protein
MMGLRPELSKSELLGAFLFERASATPVGAPRQTSPRAPGAAAAPQEGLAPLTLEQAQRWFQTVVTHPSGTEAGAVEAGLAVERVVRPGARIDAVDAIGIYHHAYRARLVECLLDDYPALAHALGHARFEALAHAYIARFPSRSPNLNGYGCHMETLCLEADEPQGRFWTDLARLEWTLVAMIHAEDAPPLSAEELTRIPPAAWSTARLVPSETLRVLRFSHPVNAFYKAFRYDEPADVPAPGPEALAVYRQGLTLWRMELTPAMADLLEELVAGKSLGEALGAMEARLTDPEELAAAASDVMAWFLAWVRGGFFKRIELPSEVP